MNSFVKAVLACILTALFFISLFKIFGYEETWKIWNINVMTPHFADLRSITSGADEFEKGLDPMKSNPTDPWQRPLNYPRLWQSLYYIGINNSHITYFGIIVIASFLAGICLLLHKANNTMIIFVMGALLSPSTLLGIERANIDLFMFFILSLSIFFMKRYSILSTIMVFWGFMLKIYPVFGFLILLRLNKSQFWKYILVVIGLVILYVIITYSDLLLIRKSTVYSLGLSYGFNVVWMKVMSMNSTIGLYVKIFTYILLLMTLPIIYFGLKSTDFKNDEAENNSYYLDAFRVGTAIYTGTFLIGNNFDYRLIFLIFTIPQLLLWSGSNFSRISKFSKVALVGIFLSFWYLIIKKFTGLYISFVIDEIANWFVYFILIYLVTCSMPDWVKKAQYNFNLKFRTTN